MAFFVFPDFEMLTEISEGGVKELQAIERAARTCYKSEDLITPDGESAKRLVSKLIASGHEAMLEHGGMSVKIICDRGVSHELVRHRMASYAQESTRYCNYSLKKFGSDLVFVIPSSFQTDDDENFAKKHQIWADLCEKSEEAYKKLIDLGAKPQEARAVLPNSLKTEVVVTANWREWRHIFKLRTDKAAHPDIRYIMSWLLFNVKKQIPVIFDDIEVDVSEWGWQ